MTKIKKTEEKNKAKRKAVGTETAGVKMTGIEIAGAGGAEMCLVREIVVERKLRTKNLRKSDVNDNAPNFTQKYYSFKIHENVPEATFVGKISAYDADDAITSQNGQISYFFDEEVESPFKIDSQSGIVWTKSSLDTEKMSFYKLKVWAIDLGKPPMKTVVTVYFDILDENDNFPILSRKTIDLIIPEDLTVGSTSELHFEIWSGNVNDTFSIDQNTGNLKISRPLDREMLSNYSILVKVYDAPPTESIRHFDICRIKIDLSDINDNAPVFAGPMLLEAFDPDFGDNSLYEFSMASDHRAPFVVDHVTGNVLLTSSLKKNTYTFTVIVFDKIKPELKSYANFTVEISSWNDLEPKFLGEKIYSLRILDNLTVGSIIKRFRVEGNDKLYFWLRNSKFFDVDPYFGVLYLIRPFDSSNFHNFSIFVGNEFENSTDRVDVRLEIIDTNNHAPIFKQDPYIFYIAENFPIFPTKIGQVEAVDQDRGLNSKLSYAITRGNLSQFTIDPITGEIKVNGPLDREFVEKYSLTVEASDSGNEKLTGTTIVTIIVIDLNDNSPKFDQPYYTGRVTENVSIGTKVLCILATDADSGTNGEVEYVLRKSVDEVPFKIDSVTGVLYTSSNIDREFKNQYHFTVRAYDNGKGHKLYSDSNVTIIVLDVNDNPPIIKVVKQDIALKYPQKLDDLVYVVDASDSDLGENGSINFSILGQDANFFTIDNVTGAIKTKILDLRSDSYALDVNIQDGGGQQASASFRFFFRPAEDCPEFTEPKDKTVFTLLENSTPTDIASFKALSRKSEPFNKILYSASPRSFILAFFGGTERNAVDTTLPNGREVFVPSSSFGGYRWSFSRKLRLSFLIGSGLSGRKFQAIGDRFRSVGKGKYR
uniref:Cadherin domain-containing protein n=1 Tax=Romanomermis culicivorax TaxID=13658 RepID=A0A915J8L7_ROMCU